MPATKKGLDYIHNYDKEHYDVVRIKVSKDEHLPELLNIVIERSIAKSKSSYILEAVKEKLKNDGVW